MRVSWLSAPNEFHWKLMRDEKSQWEIDGMWYGSALLHVASPASGADVRSLRVTLGITAETASLLRHHVVRRVTEQVLPLPGVDVSAP